MNILIVSHYSIYPPKTGASIAQYGMLKYLTELCNISLVIPQYFTPTTEELEELQKLLPRVKIYTFQKEGVSNKPLKKAKMPRNRQKSNLNPIDKLSKIKNILKKYIPKKYIPKIESNNFSNTNIDNGSEENRFRDNNLKDKALELEQIYCYNPFHLHKKEFIEKVNEIILNDKIDIVQLEFNENLNLVDAIPNTVKKIFVEHECRFQRIESHLKAKQIKTVFGNYIYNINKSIEVAFLRKFDAIFTFCKPDLYYLKSNLNQNKKIDFFCSPFPILDIDFKDLDRKNFQLLNKLIFVGPEEHFPNQDAIEWFIDEAATDIFNKFGLKLYVVGKWSQKTVKKYEKHPSRVQFTGYIEDLYSFAKGSISVSPVRIGGGIKTKILLAMAQGIPVISTTFASNGIDVKHLENIIIANKKDEFCWSVEYLIDDLNRTFKICENARNFVKKNYSQSVVSALRYRFYTEILGRTDE